MAKRRRQEALPIAKKSWRDEINNEDSDGSDAELTRYCGAEESSQFAEANNDTSQLLHHVELATEDEGDEDDVDEPTADAALARWWRSECRSNEATRGTTAAATKNLAFLERSEAGRCFLAGEASGLRDKVSKGDVDASIHASLASFLWRLRDFYGARQQYNRALTRSGNAPGQRRHRGRWANAVEMLNRQIAAHEVQRAATIKMSGMASPAKNRCVERRAMSSLSYEEFIECYARSRVPVIITGGCASGMVGGNLKKWSSQELEKRLGSRLVPLKEPSLTSMQWASLEDAGTVPGDEFIRLAREGKTSRYLFDYSLPANRPDLAEELSIPMYFANDLLQGTPEGSLYREGWPSLFVAPQGSLSELHVDSFGSHFMMALLEGTKRWRFYSPEDIPYLSPSYSRSPDPSFEVDLSQEWNKDIHPLVSLASPMDCVLEAGEVLFVPAGCPHRVEGLTPTVALSMNYVDPTNIELAKKEIRVAANTDPKAARLLQALHSGVPSAAPPAGGVEFVPFTAFKRG